MIGNSGQNTLKGGKGNDRVEGGDGNDHLYGGAGHDKLDGGAGADRLEGGQGNDHYHVDHQDDQVIEKTGEGIDTVFASANHVLAEHVERLTLTGTADLTGTGNAGDNLLKGNDGHNQLYGEQGNDRLEGGAGNDKLYGGEGHDKLDGGAGADRLEGGQGNDHYYVNHKKDRGLNRPAKAWIPCFLILTTGWGRIWSGLFSPAVMPILRAMAMRAVIC